ncbi:unnamed protein product [Cuscuta europaea]|uniref:Uncharacterized protein n=1 Tax=Cuscuta europaea TaxID=41803 RepID=A0A9P1E661_CUSEU|nr:unnamed protein product [Cuscuta europaea]
MVMVPSAPTGGEDHGNCDCCSGESSPTSISTSNWQIAHGSLEGAVIFESTDSPIDSDSTPNSHLIAKPHSPDSGPCEIKICFAQRNEIQQVYVRSSARVYEIYYASSVHGENEYLCTVRCHAAEREGHILLASNEDEDACKPHMEVIKEGSPDMEKFTGKVKSGSSSEEEWVDVKVPGVPTAENGVNWSVNHSAVSDGGSIEELYEATAEIRDAEPCASLTIRFLSLQSKDCLYVDEVYIFGDPFVPVDSENPPIPTIESSAQSSLMAMLVPTLLQLSKSAINQTDTHSSDNRQRKDDANDEAFTRTDMIDDNTNGIHCEERSMIANVHETLPPKQLTSDKKNNAPEDIGRVLGQLVERVNRIEEICLRFEETMIKPINSMDVRLQRVEEQLEILAKNSQHTGLPSSCKRFSAPSFSCTDSNFGSFYNEGNDHHPNLASELNIGCPDDDKLSSPTDSSSISVSSPHTHPSLVIDAPEFSCGDEEEQEEEANLALEHSRVCGDLDVTLKSPVEEKKKAVSIDDALAAALSGFISTSTTSFSEPSKKTEEVSGSNPNGEAVGISEYCPNSSVFRNKYVRDEIIEGLPSKYSQSLTVTAPEEKTTSNYTSGASHADEKPKTVEMGGDDAIEETGLYNRTITITAPKFTLEDLEEDLQHCERESNETCALNDDSVNHVINEEISSDYALQESQTMNKSEMVEGGGGGADILERSRHSVPSMDFNIPILEVSFGSHEEDSSGMASLPLEILLGGSSVHVENGTKSTISDGGNNDVMGRDVDLRDNDSLVDYLSSSCCANVDEGSFVVSSSLI